MADENTQDMDVSGLENMLQYLVAQGAASGANEAQLKAYEAVLQNLKDRFGDYSNLKPADYKSIKAQKLGPSGLGNIQNDAQARADEQAAISELGNIAASGGLTLADKNALNQLEQTLSRSASARNASIANQFAARGQLGSGQQLAMQLSGAQNATENANKRGEDIAAQAQDRAMKAIIEKGSASRALSNDDYARKARAAEANDSIARYNASMATDAAKYNNTLLGQSYEDQLKKLQGETNLTNSMNTALLGKGNQQAAGIASQGNLANGTIGSIFKGFGKSGGGGGGSDPGLDYGGYQDLGGGRGGSADLSGGGSLASDDYGAGFDVGGSSPDEWEQWGSFGGDE